jgi:predicted RNase H-like nuclease (RuvC/YqgF family)
MHMPATSTTEEIARLTKRLEQLQERAESELRQKLKEARAVVTDLEMQLSSITGRPSATMIKAADPKRWAPITDEQLEVMILFLLQKEGHDGLNGKTIGQWIKKYPTVLKRVGSGPGTKFFVP